jgi:hypothetical protein
MDCVYCSGLFLALTALFPPAQRCVLYGSHCVPSPARAGPQPPTAARARPALLPPQAEHSLELHTPYIVHTMRGSAFKLVPIMVGALSSEG